MYLSIIVPAYNEENRLPKTLKEMDEYLRKQSYDPADPEEGGYEIIVVNDGSKDKTAQVVRDLSHKIKNLRLIDNKINQGKGGVVKQGMLSARGEYRLFADADNSTSIDQVEKILPQFKNGYDVVIGSRNIKGAVLDPPQPWLRGVLFGGGFKLYRKIILGLWQIQDTQCGFKCFTKKSAEAIFPKCKIDRFAFDPEILIIARKMGYRIKEVPVHWKNDLESKVKFKSVVKMALDLLKIKWNVIGRKYD